MNKILIGADPELFLRNKNTLKMISAVGLIGGSKMEPRYISDEGHAIQEDNVMVEFNIPPSNSWDKLYYNIEYVIDYLKNILSKDLELYIKPSVLFESNELDTPQAQMFGCEPDYNTWLNDRNPNIDSNTNLRTAGKIDCQII